MVSKMGKCIHEHVHTIQSTLFIFWKNSLVYIFLGSLDTKKKACPCLNMDASDTAACVSSENNNNNFLNFGHGQDMMAKKKKIHSWELYWFGDPWRTWMLQQNLFIHGLGWNTATEGLCNLFSYFFQLWEATVILDKHINNDITVSCSISLLAPH